MNLAYNPKQGSYHTALLFAQIPAFHLMISSCKCCTGTANVSRCREDIYAYPGNAVSWYPSIAIVLSVRILHLVKIAYLLKSVLTTS